MIKITDNGIVKEYDETQREALIKEYADRIVYEVDNSEDKRLKLAVILIGLVDGAETILDEDY